jgi:hypothetical protein
VMGSSKASHWILRESSEIWNCEFLKFIQLF